MPDREKIISWVECLAEDDWRLFHSESEVQNIAKAVLALLKEQEAEPEIEGGGSTWWYVCSECRGAIDESDRYCRHCGARMQRKG